MTEVRTEREGDEHQIRRLHELAFEGAVEADLVDALRGTEAYVPELSLVATESSRLVGHLLLTRAQLDTDVPVLALAPMAVLPDRQGAGIGAALVREGLERAGRTDAKAVVVVGHADYYPRFGFEPAGAHGITAPFDVPDEVWMVFKLPGYDATVRGRVIYPPAFDEA